MDKKEYKEPKLTSYGDVREITKDTRPHEGKGGEKTDGEASFVDDR